jgi:AcrR family transcriptional regulator
MSIVKGLSRDDIVDKAFDFVDQYGLDNLSMRKLAGELGVKAMSLYNHVKNKDEVIDALVEKAMSLVVYDETTSWQASMRNRAYALKEVLMKHDWAILPLLSRMNIGPFVLHDFNKSIGILYQHGFSYGECDQIISALNSYVYGYTISMLQFPIEEDNFQEIAEEYHDFAPKEEFPHLWGLTNEIRNGQYNGITDFELGLSFTIKGIEETLDFKGEK